jgi:hypothetical protein
MFCIYCILFYLLFFQNNFEIVSDKSNEILDMECDMALLHAVITKFPSKIDETEKIEEYIEKALALFEEYPPKSLPELSENWILKW